MKNERGITLISLVMTIILIMILATVGTYTGLEAYNGMRAQAFIAKMTVIQEAVDKLCTEYSISEINAMGLDSSSSAVPSEATVVLTDVIAKGANLKCWYDVDNNPTNYRYFDVNSIDTVLGIKDFDTAIWVNPTSRNVIAVTGVNYEDTKYYRQYDLEGGQVLPEPNINVNFALNFSVKTYDGKAEIVLNKESSTETVFSKVKYYKQKDGAYGDAKLLSNVSKITLDESGTYKIEATDSTGNTQSQEGIKVAIVNKPMLVDGMTPVKFNGTTMVNTTSTDPDWYNYAEGEKRWANVKLKDGSVYVWIPRFAYEIASGSKINIKFLKDFSQTGTDGRGISGTYKVAPAFSSGVQNLYANGEWSNEITGFWVAKYETTDNGTKPQSISTNAKQTWRSVTAQNVFSYCRQMEAENRDTYFGTSFEKASGICTNGVYAVDNNNIDTHLMKNSEWGAVAYLTYSADYGGGNPTKSGSYYTNQSTANNVTQVYGLNAGSNELVAAGTNISIFNSENKSSKYATLYASAEANNTIYGDALKETKGWLSCTATYPTAILTRGGVHTTTSGTGLFAYQSVANTGDALTTFRPVIIVEY